MFGRSIKTVITPSPSYIGSWKANSPHNAGTTKQGISHESVVCKTVIDGQASQTNNALTTKENCYKKDNDVTEVGKLADTLSKTGKKQTQYVAWHDNKPPIMPKDLKEFTLRRESTKEEDANFQRSKTTEGSFNYRKPGFDFERYKNIPPIADKE